VFWKVVSVKDAGLVLQVQRPKDTISATQKLTNSVILEKTLTRLHSRHREKRGLVPTAEYGKVEFTES
jgi:hypothetical protein